MATLLPAQALVAASGWEVEKHEKLEDFFEHPTLGLIGISVVHKSMDLSGGPSAFHMWSWDKNLGLTSKKEYPFKCELNDGLEFLGRDDDAKSGGWYFAFDKVVSGTYLVRNKTELSIVKLTFDGKVEQSQSYPLVVAQDAEGYDVLYELYRHGQIGVRSSFQTMSLSRKYILLCNAYRPGAVNYFILDRTLKQVAQGRLPMNNVNLKGDDVFRYGISVDDQGAVHCLDVKQNKNEAAVINLRVVPLNGTPQSFSVKNPSYSAYPYFTFLHDGERRYVMKYEDKALKGNDVQPSKFHIYAVRNGMMTSISGPLVSETFLKGDLGFTLLDFAEDEQNRIVSLNLDIRWGNETGAEFDIRALLIHDGELQGTQIIQRRLGIMPWDSKTESLFDKENQTWCLFESREDRDSKTVVGGSTQSYLYKESLTKKGEGTQIEETTDLGLYVCLSEQIEDGNILIPAIRKGKLNIYTLRP